MPTHRQVEPLRPPIAAAAREVIKKHSAKLRYNYYPWVRANIH